MKVFVDSGREDYLMKRLLVTLTAGLLLASLVAGICLVFSPTPAAHAEGLGGYYGCAADQVAILTDDYWVQCQSAGVQAYLAPVEQVCVGYAVVLPVSVTDVGEQASGTYLVHRGDCQDLSYSQQIEVTVAFL